MKKFLKICGIAIIALVVLPITLFYGSAFYYGRINPEAGAVAGVKMNAISFPGYESYNTETRQAEVVDLIACQNFTYYKQDYKYRMLDISSLDVEIRGTESLMRVWKGYDNKQYREYKHERDSLVGIRSHLEGLNARFIDSLRSEITAMKDMPFDGMFIDHTFIWNYGRDYGYSVGVYSREEKKLLSNTIIENIIEKSYYEDFIDILNE